MMKSVAIAGMAASAVMLAGTGGARLAQAQEPMLTGTVWELQRIQYNDDTLLEPTNPENYTIEFFEDGNVAIQADCNVVRGTYDADSTDFITLGASTLAACPPDAIDDEFRQGLQDAAIYFFRDGNLYMDLFADAGTMMFAPAAETADVEAETEVVEAEAEAVTETTTEGTTETTTEPIRGLW